MQGIHSSLYTHWGDSLQGCFWGAAQPPEQWPDLQSSPLSWAEMRDPQVCRPIAIAVLMRLLQQLTGVTPLLVYLQPIFENMNVLLVSNGQASVSPRT